MFRSELCLAVISLNWKIILLENLHLSTLSPQIAKTTAQLAWVLSFRVLWCLHYAHLISTSFTKVLQLFKANFECRICNLKVTNPTFICLFKPQSHIMTAKEVREYRNICKKLSKLWMVQPPINQLERSLII